tara:strand:+ start:407 stop:568 length:162 start_codon:yes stop_codon:yes gene_type:complete
LGVGNLPTPNQNNNTKKLKKKTIKRSHPKHGIQQYHPQTNIFFIIIFYIQKCN